MLYNIWDDGIEAVIFATELRKQLITRKNMSNAIFKVPAPVNERVRNYAPGTPERQDLKDEIERLRSQVMEIPMYIGGEEVYKKS